MNIIEEIKLIVESRRSRNIATGATGAALGGAIGGAVNQYKQNQVASRIGKRVLDKASAKYKQVYGDIADRTKDAISDKISGPSVTGYLSKAINKARYHGSVSNPHLGVANYRDTLQGMDLKQALPKHVAMGAAAGGAGLLLAKKAVTKMKDKQKHKTAAADRKKELEHQANQNQLNNLRNQQGMQTNHSHF